MKIALCILAYNSARDLERILSKSSGYFDDILILDGGSKDETPKVAERYGARIFYQKQKGYPAAEGKNFLASNTLADYILVWDTDEDFPIEFLKEMHNIAELNHLCYKFPRINLPDWSGWPDYQVRFYRKKDCMWVRRVHEIVAHKSGKPADQVDCIILYKYPIRHYPGSLFSRLNRFQRNMHLLIDELKRGSRDFTLDDLTKEVDFLVSEVKNRYKNQEVVP